jgi:hypothetical protein
MLLAKISFTFIVMLFLRMMILFWHYLPFEWKIVWTKCPLQIYINGKYNTQSITHRLHCCCNHWLRMYLIFTEQSTIGSIPTLTTTVGSDNKTNIVATMITTPAYIFCCHVSMCSVSTPNMSIPSRIYPSRIYHLQSFIWREVFLWWCRVRSVLTNVTRKYYPAYI